MCHRGMGAGNRAVRAPDLFPARKPEGRRTRPFIAKTRRVTGPPYLRSFLAREHEPARPPEQTGIKSLPGWWPAAGAAFASSRAPGEPDDERGGEPEAVVVRPRFASSRSAENDEDRGRR